MMPKFFRTAVPVRVKISFLMTLFLLGAIMISSFEAQRVRDFRTEAASCASGQSSLTLRPSGDFDNSLWSQVPATGAYFDKIDDTGQGDGDSTYIWDDTPAGNTAFAYHPTISLGANQPIQSVIINVRARLASGTTAQIAPTLYISGGEYYGARSAVTSTYTLYGSTWTRNPRTGANWTTADVNNALIAADSTRPSQPNAINITQMWMQVCYITIPAASVDIKANGSNGPITVGYNSSANITWSSSNASSCTISPSGWSGTSGSQSTGNLTSAVTYTANCSGVGGGGSDSVTVNVEGPPSPNLNFSADSTSVSYNSGTTLRWSSSNTTSCSASNAWSGSKSLNGSESTGNLTSSKTYTLSCSGSGGSTSKTVTINVGSRPGGGGGTTNPPPIIVRPPNPNPPVPKVSTSAKNIVLRSGVNGFLVGAKEVEITIDGTGINKKIVITRDSQDYEIETSSLKVGSNYTVRVKGEFMLTQSQVFKLNQNGTNLSLQPLLVGDINKDEKISENDAVDFLSGFLGDKFYDLNSDGVVNSFDYSVLINNIKE